MDRFEKQSYEEYTVSTDFSRNFTADEVVLAQSMLVVDAEGNDVLSTITNPATLANDGASKVQVLVRAGSRAASPYKLTFRCVTSRGHKWEHDVLMNIRDK